MIKNIGYILGKFPGVEPFIFNEIKEIKNLGFEVILFSTNNPKGKITRDEWTDITFYVKNYFSPKVIFSHLYYFFSNPRLYIDMLFKNKQFGGGPIFWKSVYYAYIIKMKNINHIHAHFAWDAVDAAMIISKLCGVSYSLTSHQSDIHRHPIRLFQKLAGAKFILTCTKGNKQYLGKRFGPKIENKTYNVYHGIDLAKFYPSPSFSEKDIDILGIGNLLIYKGFNYLIDACKILRDKGLDFKCVILGDGEDRECLENQIIKSGLKNYVKMLGQVPYKNIKSYYERTKVFSLPVTILDDNPHGIPNVIAEAMAMRLPVVVTDVPHIPELVTDKETGFTVPDKDPVALARTIAKLLSDNKLREVIGQKARERIVADFDFNKHTKRIAEFFHVKTPKECR